MCNVEKSLHQTLCLVGLNDGSSVDQQVSYISATQRDTVKTLNTVPAYVGLESAACVLHNSLYVVGLGTGYNELWKYNEATGWVQLASMPAGRRRHCVEIVDSNIYVLGGWVDADSSVLSSVLRFSVADNTWSAAGQLTHAVESAACLSYKNTVYVFGGTTTGDTAVSHVQRYDPIKQACTLMTSSMPAAYRLMRAVLYESSAVLIGRHTCYIYDFEAATWAERKQFKTGVYHFGLSLHNQTLFIAGGGTSTDGKWTCRDDVRSLPLIDFITDKQSAWQSHAKLPKPALVHAYSPSPLYVSWKD